MYIVDRIENNIAICIDENEKIEEVLLSDIEGNVTEGAIIIKINGKWHIDKVKTVNRKKYIEELTKNMWKN